ncbi:MAG: cobalamin biosynthesis protein CobD [Lachnospiraceae bacterium]|nr:cobalamin biosynthesis protein CobD [Lachnospiraceae bacterium]
MIERIIVICLGFLLDLIIGDPNYSWHPIRLIGKLIDKTDKLLRKIFSINEQRELHKTRKLVAGTFLVVVVLLVSLGGTWLALYVAEKIHRLVKLTVEVILAYQMLAVKSLKDESMKVYHALKAGDIQGARYAVSMIVGRDTKDLDEKGITKAAVETVAENTSDGVIAPLFFMLVFGVAGGVFYKAVNTMDSMIGYKNDRNIYIGRVAAKLDDVVNYIPARVSAVCMLMAGGIMGYSVRDGWRIFCRDRFNHASPNSAQTESVCAGLLGVKLAGDAYYFGKLYSKPTIGDAVKEIYVEHIKVVNKFAYVTAVITLVVGVGMLLLLELLL